jgi:nicotinate phosphoribosyltransferase
MTSPWVNDSNAALLTDLYELTMLQSYFDEGMTGTAVFDLFMRRLPRNRNYLVACGLEHVLHYLETFSFSPDAIDYLDSLHRFSPAFLESLRSLRFTGDVYAVPEGTIVFPNEPLIEVIAPLPQAQIIETFLMNQIQLGTLAATKAARVVCAAQGRSVVDFGLRRMQGADAGLKQPRAFYIGGVDSTSNVLAGQVFGIPLAGTMAHSYVQSFDSEIEAFRSFLRSYPSAILLIDTYDVYKGLDNIIALARESGSGFQVTGVRLDSGDLAAHAREVRRRLDAAGLHQLKIFASSNLDEYEIEKLLTAGVPMNGFGVGRNMATSADAPVLDTAYKLTEYAGRPRMKLSESKSTLPGRKQIYRERSGGRALRDVIALADEEGISGEPLLSKVMANGRRTQSAEHLDACRERCRMELNSLPERLMRMTKVDPSYPVELSPGMSELKAATSRSAGRE